MFFAHAWAQHQPKAEYILDMTDIKLKIVREVCSLSDPGKQRAADSFRASCHMQRDNVMTFGHSA